jgi:hypothetical protein
MAAIADLNSEPGKPMSRDELMHKLAANPPFVEAPKSGKDFVIAARLPPPTK